MGDLAFRLTAAAERHSDYPALRCVRCLRYVCRCDDLVIAGLDLLDDDET